MRKHTGEKPFKCDLCDAAFVQKSHLTVHTMRKHTSEKTFKCDLCDAASVRKSHLNLHKKRKHTGEDLVVPELRVDARSLVDVEAKAGDRELGPKDSNGECFRLRLGQNKRKGLTLFMLLCCVFREL